MEDTIVYFNTQQKRKNEKQVKPDVKGHLLHQLQRTRILEC